MSEPLPEQCALPLSSLRLLVSPLQLMSAALWGIVQHRAVQHYGLLEHFITAVQDNIPGVLTYSERLHIILGLRAKMVLEMCNCNDRQNIDIHLKKMDDLIMEHADEETQSKMKASFVHFSKAIYSLLDDPHERDMFYQKTLPSEFDLKFDSSLQTLVRKLLLHLENILPVPTLQQTSLWLGVSPSVLKECEDVLTQPDLLLNLIQHHKVNYTFSPGDYFNDFLFPELQTDSNDTQFQSAYTKEEEAQYNVPSVDVILSFDDDDGDHDDDEEDYNTDVTQRQSVGKKEPFRCPVCGLIFDTHHLLRAHSISGCPGDCKEENTITPDNLNFETNILRVKNEPVAMNITKHNFHGDNIVCLMCGQVYTHGTLLEHQKGCVVRYEQERRPTDQCSFSLQQSRRYPDISGKQVCKRSRRIKTCSKCGQAFTSSADLTSHMRAHTEEDSHICGEGEKDFDDNEKYKFHQENGYKERDETPLDVDYTQMGIKQCVVALRRLSSTSEISQGMSGTLSSEDNRWKENFEECQTKFFSKHLETPVIENNLYYNLIKPCRLNSLASVTENNVETDSDFQIRQIESENSPSTKPRIMKCTLCDQTFSEILLMKRHYFNVHRVKGSYRCPSCKRTFVRLCDMVKHHQNMRLIRCKTCKRCFTKLAHLKKHEARYKNTCATPHICETCGRSCLNAGVLKHHQKAHTTDESTVCTVCNKKFSTKFCLRVHMKRHTGGFLCPICPKIFYKITYLTRHIDRHNGKEPYLCEICGQGWPTQNLLDRHMIKHTDERPFKCDQCDKTFKRETVLNAHIRSKHLGLRPYVCHVCGKAFKISSLLKQHMIKHTGVYPHNCSRCGKGFGRLYCLKKHRETECL